MRTGGITILTPEALIARIDANGRDAAGRYDISGFGRGWVSTDRALPGANDRVAPNYFADRSAPDERPAAGVAPFHRGNV